MATPLLIFSLLYLQSSFLNFGAHGVNIKVYKHSNFTGLVWESNSTDNCNDVPQDKYKGISSIRTDTCFIAYIGSNCYPISSKKFLPGDTISSSDQNEGNLWIGSFHICNEKEGANQLNIDITKWFTFDNPLENYRNVCSCINIPQYVQNIDKWSIDNHHNDLLAYYEPDCKEDRWSPKFIAAGRNDDSWSMQDHQKTEKITNTTYKIQSFGPVQNSTYFRTSCKSLDVTVEITKYEHETTVESGTAVNTELANKLSPVMTDRVGKLQKHINELSQKQDRLQNEIEKVVKQHHDDFEKLADNMLQLQKQFQNSTSPPKVAFQELFRG